MQRSNVFSISLINYIYFLQFCLLMKEQLVYAVGILAMLKDSNCFHLVITLLFVNFVIHQHNQRFWLAVMISEQGFGSDVRR